jgi:rare lipoprotein A (peptidoglycan hydrolase)
MMAVFPVAPVDAAETTASLRAKRQVLVERIAVLTDEVARAQLRADNAQRRREMSAVAFDQTRKRFAAHAVDAYLDGVQDAEDQQLRRRAWADALAEQDREVLGEYRDARERAEKDEAAAEVASTEAKQVSLELDAARAALERTIADRVRYERAAAKAAARRAAAAGGGGGRGSRATRATMSQSELMRLYRFGPASGAPDGLVATGEVLNGRASWYGPGFDGRATASGAIFDQEGWTVAHRTLPLGTILLISHGGRSVVALVNDRGPFVGGRILDLSHGVANYLGTVHAGVAPVRAEVLVPQ